LNLELFYEWEEVEQHMKHLDLTSELCLKVANWVIPEEERQVFNNLEFVLEKCNPTKITSFEMQGGCGDICENLLCTHLSRFTNLKELSIDLYSPMKAVLPQIALLPKLETLVLTGMY